MFLSHQHPRRDFSPGKTARFGRPTFDPSTLVKYSPKWGYSRIFNYPFRGSHWRPRMHTVVITVDGASRGNHLPSHEKLEEGEIGQPTGKARGSWGVFFGPNSERNASGLLTGESQTSIRAELEAVRQALLSVREMCQAGVFDRFRFNEIIIKTDSQYVHSTFNVYIWRYEFNGYTRTDGTRARHQTSIREIHHLICELESWHRAVRFWRVDRKWVQDADRLANEALDAMTNANATATAVSVAATVD